MKADLFSVANRRFERKPKQRRNVQAPSCSESGESGNNPAKKSASDHRQDPTNYTVPPITICGARGGGGNVRKSWTKRMELKNRARASLKKMPGIDDYTGA